MDTTPAPPPIEALRDHARAAFRNVFDSDPDTAAAAPGRVNLIGEHTDYNRGFALPIAIDRWCVAVGCARADTTRCRISAPDFNQTIDADLRAALDPDRVRNAYPLWARYALGVVAQFQRADPQRPPPGFDAAITGSIPVGAGLASSAAAEVCTATLLKQFTPLPLDPLQTARLCQRAEHEFAGVPCGLMDQLVSSAARPAHAMLIDFADETSEHIPLDLPAEIVVIDSGVRHELATSEYAARRSACERAARLLGIRSLRDTDEITLRQRAHELPQPERDAALHVVAENARVARAAELLQSRNAPAHERLVSFGGLMNESHDSLRDLYRVSCPEVDDLVDALRADTGVYGARMTGAGFGGCIVALREPGPLDRLAAALSSRPAARPPRAIFKAEPVAGAAPIAP